MAITDKTPDLEPVGLPLSPDEAERMAREKLYGKPQWRLNMLLTKTGMSDKVPFASDFLVSYSARVAVTEQAKKQWYQSDLKDRNSFELMVLGHTVEVMKPEPSAAFLHNSIGDVLSRTTARPTLSFVTLPVMQIVQDPDFQSEYLDRMLAEPGEAFNAGWAPVGSPACMAKTIGWLSS
jgi:hypothetical protein